MAKLRHLSMEAICEYWRYVFSVAIGSLGHFCWDQKCGPTSRRLPGKKIHLSIVAITIQLIHSYIVHCSPPLCHRYFPYDSIIWGGSWNRGFFQFSSTYSWDFPWNQPSSSGTSMAMETPGLCIRWLHLRASSHSRVALQIRKVTDDSTKFDQESSILERLLEVLV